MTGIHNTTIYEPLGKSRGAILFAYNTKVNYINLAIKSAQLIKHFLKIPVTLVTDQNLFNPIFDNVIVKENDMQNTREGNISWRNGNRFLAYNLSPYDETLIIDSDYIILDTKLEQLFNCTTDYRIFDDNIFLENYDATRSNSMGRLSINFLWATVIIFKKTLKTKLLFDLVKSIQKNYNFYYELYQVNINNYRNDFAFAIADNIINGYSKEINCAIPWKMMSLNKVDNLDCINVNLIIKSGNKTIISPLQSLHIMDKEFLLSEKFDRFLKKLL